MYYRPNTYFLAKKIDEIGFTGRFLVLIHDSNTSILFNLNGRRE